VVKFRPQLVYHQETFPIPIEYVAGLALENVWKFLEERKPLPLTGIPAADRPARSVVAMPTTLSRFPLKHIELNKYELCQSCHALRLLLQKCEFKDIGVGYKTTKTEECVVNSSDSGYRPKWDYVRTAMDIRGSEYCRLQ